MPSTPPGAVPQPREIDQQLRRRIPLLRPLSQYVNPLRKRKPYKKLTALQDMTRAGMPRGPMSRMRSDQARRLLNQ